MLISGTLLQKSMRRGQQVRSTTTRKDHRTRKNESNDCQPTHQLLQPNMARDTGMIRTHLRKHLQIRQCLLRPTHEHPLCHDPTAWSRSDPCRDFFQAAAQRSGDADLSSIATVFAASMEKAVSMLRVSRRPMPRRPNVTVTMTIFSPLHAARSYH